MKFVESGGRSRTVTYTYDSENNLASVSDSTGDTTEYFYDEFNWLESVFYGDISKYYAFGPLGRLVHTNTYDENDTRIYRESYEWQDNADGTTSNQLREYYAYSDYSEIYFEYTYDANGNITSIDDAVEAYSYVYDSQNQLIRENLPYEDITVTWEYDGAGNILNRKEYAYTTGTLGTPLSTKNYVYGDSDWGDLLTNFDGKAITYDDIGNMLTYGSKTFTWEHGRNLASLSNGGTTWSYTYDADGMRTGRTNGSTAYTYVYTGSQLTEMTVGTNTLRFSYAPDGTPFTVTFNGTVYYYITDPQGNVVKILDRDGRSVMSYYYDAWGNPLPPYNPAANSIGALNPLRYRGYVYDTETGLYYLQSRYYDPEIGRFISADSQISGVGGEALGYNQFAYCFNNPVNLTDSAGNWPNWGKLFSGASLLAVGLMACAAAATVVTAGACAPLLAAACVTFVAGGMTVLNGTAEMVESATDYNYMRDGLYGGDAEFYEAQKTVFETTAELGTAALGVASGSPDLCFVAGTMVLISEGAKAIEEVEAGDYVWAWDEETGEVALKQVVETYVNKTSELVHVFVNGEEIITTPSHPFYSPVKGWTDAVHLRAGDILVLVNGEYVVVEKIQHEILEGPITVYNFQVADYHTYYVGDTGVLVHNDCPQREVAKDGPWSAKVSEGGMMDHNPPHAHIYYKQEKLASVTATGDYIAESFGKLNRQGRKFVKKFISEISEGIKFWWG